MRSFTSVLFVLSTVFAYQVNYPGDSQSWNTTGPNYLRWERVDTDPLNFTAVLTNQNIGYDEVLDTLIDGTLGSFKCSTPNGGWPSGTAFRVNLARDAQHLDSLLAQSNEFNITAVSSGASTTSSASTQSQTTTSATSAATTTSSQTSTTPTGVSAASLSVDAQGGLLAAVIALAVLITNLV